MIACDVSPVAMFNLLFQFSACQICLFWVIFESLLPLEDTYQPLYDSILLNAMFQELLTSVLLLIASALVLKDILVADSQQTLFHVNRAITTKRWPQLNINSFRYQPCTKSPWTLTLIVSLEFSKNKTTMK